MARPRQAEAARNFTREPFAGAYVGDCRSWTGFEVRVNILAGQTMNSSNPISLRQLRCFVTVAQELHFSRAAGKLNMRQPPLTQRIQDMERDLGVDLFRRTGSKVELTEAGQMVLNSAKETLAQADAFCEAAKRAARGECRQIRVGLTIAALFFRSIQLAMRALQEDYPDVSLDLVHISSGSALEVLRQRKIDLCLMRPFSAPLPPDCEGTTIERDRLMLLLPVGHPQARAEKVPLSAIVDERFISLTRKKALYDQIMNLWVQSGLKPRVAQEAQNGPAVMALVAAGLGLGILPSSLQAIRFEHIVWKTIEIDDRWTMTSLDLVYHKDALAERAPARFIECLRRYSCDVAGVVGQLS
jgi:DNA-binding transcriptional LysR family regulator